MQHAQVLCLFTAPDCGCFLSVMCMQRPHKKAREIRAFLHSGPGAPYLFYFLRASAAASHPMPPNMVVETRMNKNTVIGTMMAIKNSPQNPSPHRRFGKNQPRVYPIGRGRASFIKRSRPGHLY